MPRRNTPAGAAVEAAVEGLLGEWKRGMLTFWALGLLAIHPMYGLEILREVEASTHGRMRLRPSTIYQLLRRLEARGLVTSRWESTTQGPPRAYYELTAAGREVVRRYLVEVFLPDSPIAAGLNRLMPQLFQALGVAVPSPRPKKKG